jgi:predicted Zn-dependent protease
LYEQLGLYELAFIEMERGARLQPGIPPIALKAARSALSADHAGAAEGWYEYALEIGPNDASVLTDAAAFYARTGRPDRAKTLLQSFESLESPDVGVWGVAGRTYEFLNMTEKANHAATCAAVGQPACW